MEQRKALIRRYIQVLVFLLIHVGVIFGGAGTFGWGWGWAFMGIYVFGVLLNGIFVLPRNPSLVAERAQRPENMQDWDRLPSLVVGFLGPVLTALTGGLDHRWGWTGEFPIWLQWAGLALGVLAYLLMTWAVVVNRYFSGVVRIQEDRGHQTVSTGPYAIVRHPGYVGMMGMNLATTLTLGSCWTLIPAGITMAVTVYRTVMEDRMLRTELAGYEEYAGRTRWRLIPGIW